jgi:type IV secretion system protein TrbI
MNNNQKLDPPEASPSLLGRLPTRGIGVRRLNNVPKHIAIGLGISVVALLMYATIARGNQQYKKSDTSLKASQTASPPREIAQEQNTSILAGTPTNEIITPYDESTSQVPSINNSQSPPPMPIENNSVPASPYAEQWANYKQKQISANQRRESALMAALNSPTTIQSKQNNNSPSSQNTGIEIGGSFANNPVNMAGLIANNGSNSGGDNDAEFNGQSAKRGFLQQRNIYSNYSNAMKTPAISIYELKAGSIIPAIMISGINSDLPGQIIGQVSENVYDSATGKHLLIPQGARLVGIYDNAVTTGQNRVLIAWNRIIFSDGASLNLDLMPASDQSGYAGFNDKVNNHFAKTFGSALLMSIFSAGVQVSQPQATNGQNINSGQTIAGAIGQQLGQAGSQVIGRNIRVQPTLQIRPGYRFNISVTKDFIISPVEK